MLTIKRPECVSGETLRTFKDYIASFIVQGEEDLTVDEVIDHVCSFNEETDRLWFVYENHIFKGYVLAGFIENMEGAYVAIHQLYLRDVKDRSVYNKIFTVLKGLGEEHGATKLICSTKHNPKAFARLIGHGFGIDSYVLTAPLNRG